jgi:hypothetical protein
MRLFVTLLLALSFVSLAETRLRSSQVPSALRKAIDKQYSGNDFVDAYKLREDGKTVYEVVIQHQGDHYIVVGDSREIIETSLAEEDDGEEVPISELPRQVRITAERSTTGAEVVEAYRLQDNDGDYYEVIIETRRDDHLLVISPSGRLLERRKLEGREEEEEEEEDDDAWSDLERVRELQLARAPSSFRRNALAAVKGKLETVFELKRDGEKFYEFHVNTKDGIHRVILDRKGKVVHAISPGEERDDGDDDDGEDEDLDGDE